MSAAELRHHLGNLASALIRIEHQLLRLESGLTPASGRESGLSTTQWLKVLAGLALPFVVLVWTGNVELARRLLAP
jgi:hypothetical protein